MNEEKQRPRLSIELTEKQNMDLMRLLPWGAKGPLFSSIVDDVIELLDKYGTIIIAAVLDKKLKAGDFKCLQDALKQVPKKGKKNANNS